MRLGNVLPDVPLGYGTNRRVGYPKLPGQDGEFFASGAAGSNLMHGFFCELGGTALLSAERGVDAASFSPHIPVVITDGADRQMFGVDASSYVAGVHHAHPFWDRPIEQLVTSAVCRDHAIAATASTQLSVAAIGHGSTPEPASAGMADGDPTPKSLRQCQGDRHRSNLS